MCPPQDAQTRANNAENDVQSLRNKITLAEQEIKKAEERRKTLEVRLLGAALRGRVHMRRRRILRSASLGAFEMRLVAIVSG